MKFQFNDGLIWIPVKLGYEGKCINIGNCIVDTGSATTALDIDLIDFNYNKPATIQRLVGIGGGIQEVISQKVDNIILDYVMLEDVEIEFGDIQADLGISGFIGNDILSRFDLAISYFSQEILFKKI